jgi:ubiquitin-conjugating enzyme E2 O
LPLDKIILRPGDHVIWKSEGSERPAVVQYVNATERTASIMYTDSHEKEIVSVLELDSHGTGGWDVSGAFQEGLGVRLGDFVFIHPPGKSNGASRLRVPCIGEFEPWVREPPTDESGHLVGWREDLNEIGSTIAQRSPNERTYKGKVKTVQPGDRSFNWFGEVTKAGFL